MREVDGELEYLGEPAERKPALAFLLSLLAPGMGWAYLGRPGAAVALNAAVIGLVCLALVLFQQLLFFPVVPFAILAAGVLLICLMAGFDAACWARDHGSRHVLRDANHPIAYALIWGMSWALPLLVALAWLIGISWTVVAVDDDRMYPTLVEGDLLLVQRERHALPPLERGEIVVYAHDNTLLPGRVLALGGDDITFSEDVPYVNDAPLPREPLDAEAQQALVALSGPLAGVSYYTERNSRRAWPSVMPELMAMGAVEEIRLSESEVYVVNDHRGRLDDSRTWGAIERGALVGRPVFVLFSREAPGSRAPRWSRVGRRVQSVDGARGSSSARGAVAR